MKRKNKKPTNPIDWKAITISGLVDLVVGIILIIIDRVLG